MKTETVITVTKNGYVTRVVAGSMDHGEQLKAAFEKVGCHVTSPIPKPADFSRSDSEFKRAMRLFDLIE